MSDHYLVEEKVRMKVFQKREREEVTAKRVVKVSEHQKEEVREAFVILIGNEWDRIRNTRVLSVEKEWEMFNSTVRTCATRVCWYKSIGRKKRRIGWWVQEIEEMMREKRRLSEIYNTDRN